MQSVGEESGSQANPGCVDSDQHVLERTLMTPNLYQVPIKSVEVTVNKALVERALRCLVCKLDYSTSFGDLEEWLDEGGFLAVKLARMSVDCVVVESTLGESGKGLKEFLMSLRSKGVLDVYPWTT